MNKLTIPPDKSGYQITETTAPLYQVLDGGLGRLRADYLDGSSIVKAQWTLINKDYLYLLSFYRAYIGSNCEPFLIDIYDETSTLVEAICLGFISFKPIASQTGISFVIQAELEVVLDNTVLDPFRDNVVLHVRFDGKNNETNFVDLTGRHTLNAAGSAHITTDTSSLGQGSSLALNGSSWVNVLDKLDDFNFDDDPLTIEWMWDVAGLTGSPQCVLGCVGFETLLINDLAITGVNSSYSTGGGFATTLSPALPLNQWRHYAVCWDGTNGFVFENGKRYATVRTGSPHFNCMSNLRIGANGGDSPYYMLGNLQEIRVTKGIQRYLVDFTPSSIPFSANYEQ